MVLENLTHGMKQPQIIDIKIGSRLHDVDASADKITSCERKSLTTSSFALGFRVCGIRAIGMSHLKSQLNKLDRDAVKGLLTSFFGYRRTLIAQTLLHLNRIRAAVSNNYVQLISCSVLIAFGEGCDDQLQCRIIDFAHSHIHEHEFSDGNFFCGLDSLMHILESIYD